MIDFLQNAKKDVRERTKPRTVMAEAGRLLPYRLPSIFLGEAGKLMRILKKEIMKI